MMFKISKSRFQRMMEDIGATGDAYYIQQFSSNGTPLSSFEARLLLPLKCLAYGVPPHTFSDYFQMSKQFARSCCKKFDRTMKNIYKNEYLRTPTAEDLKSIVGLHRSVHGVDGMFGLLDCSHTYWKNCPKAWQGSFKGKEKACSIVLEAICDYNLWLWHFSYGYAGTLNDKNILQLSPLLESLANGEFKDLEALATIIPFLVGEEEFNNLFILVDGIYPKYSRFVRGLKEPLTKIERVFTSWQESARKDIERAFGVLQGKFQFMTRPIMLHKLKDIAARVASCVMLHNMCVVKTILKAFQNSQPVRTRIIVRAGAKSLRPIATIAQVTKTS